MENAKEYKEYLVYPDGRIWKPKTTYTRSDGVVRSFGAKWIQSRIRQTEKGKGGGYSYVDLYFEGGKKEFWLVHRLVAKLFVQNPENLPQVNHKDGDRSNNHYSNLEWVSASENQKHAYKVLQRTRRSKLTEEQQKEICQLRNVGKLPLDTIASIYGICFQTVSEIAKGKRFCLREEVK